MAELLGFVFLVGSAALVLMLVAKGLRALALRLPDRLAIKALSVGDWFRADIRRTAGVAIVAMVLMVSVGQLLAETCYEKWERQAVENFDDYRSCQYYAAQEGNYAIQKASLLKCDLEMFSDTMENSTSFATCQSVEKLFSFFN